MAYLAFVVYGSLVPLHFKPMPLDQAIAQFREVPFLQLGIGSRADWVANLLLFVPLTFLWTGALAHGRALVAGILASMFVLASAVALCLGIEFAQQFFPPRTVSQNDIFAETLGGVLGVVAWWSVGSRWMVWYTGWKRAKAPAETAERLAWAYIAVAFAYGVLPLDLTISGVEIFHKWREGKLNFLPFGALPGNPAQAVYELCSDALLWLPPALLWRLHAGRSGLQAWKMTFAAVALLELLQLFVYSRVSDVTDLFTGALGAWAGAWLGARFSGRQGRHGHPPPSRRTAGGPSWWPLALAFGWAVVLAGVFWYPFDFRTDGAFLRERFGLLQRLPFEAYYYGTEFRAITEVFHKLLFFVPLGALLAWFVVRLPWRWRGAGAVASFLLMTGVAMGIELGQVMLPGKIADMTDWVLETLGAGLGYVMFRMLHTPLRPSGHASQSPRRREGGRRPADRAMSPDRG